MMKRRSELDAEQASGGIPRFCCVAIARPRSVLRIVTMTTLHTRPRLTCLLYVHQSE
jgi:hypothetical protein